MGITFLVYVFHVAPVAGETTNSQLARLVFGQSPLYYLVQGVTALILVLAANTSFADFPRVASFLARDGFVPRQFANRGDRLAYSNGILILTVLSVSLLIVFHGETHALIPLYAVGVFLSFTLKQASMVRYWLRRRQPGWVSGVSVQGVGAMATGDDGPARALIDDRRLDHLLVHGVDACRLADRLAALARRHAPTSVGVAYVGDDPMGALDRVAATAQCFRYALA